MKPGSDMYQWSPRPSSTMASSSTTGTGMEAWLTNSNEALKLRLVRPPAELAWLRQPVEEGSTDPEEEELCGAFEPKFTYPIFGDKEVIFGYKGLKIDLSFASGSLRQYLNISYKGKLESTALEADDIEKKLYEFIPSDYTKNADTFAEIVDNDATSFRPFGTLVHRYTEVYDEEDEFALKDMDGLKVEYEIYHCTFATPGFREYHRRMQLFILLYIEGGSYIQEDEENWEFLVLYEKRTHPAAPPSSTPSSSSSTDLVTSYHFAGYVSAYPFWCYPEHVRLRLSQFVITPPYQGIGHGSKLYNAIYEYALSMPSCKELTIEDPSEEFEFLRDRNDLYRLLGWNDDVRGKDAQHKRRGLAADPHITNGAPVDKAWLEKVRAEGKYAKRQFERLIEMLLMWDTESRPVAEQGPRWHNLRLQVKERLYRFNYQILCQLDKEERKEKLKETYDNVIESYKEILKTLEGGKPQRWQDLPI